MFELSGLGRRLFGDCIAKEVLTGLHCPGCTYSVSSPSGRGMSNSSVSSSTYLSHFSFCLIFLVFAFTGYTCNHVLESCSSGCKGSVGDHA